MTLRLKRRGCVRLEQMAIDTSPRPYLKLPPSPWLFGWFLFLNTVTKHKVLHAGLRPSLPAQGMAMGPQWLHKTHDLWSVLSGAPHPDLGCGPAPHPGEATRSRLTTLCAEYQWRTTSPWPSPYLGAIIDHARLLAYRSGAQPKPHPHHLTGGAWGERRKT